jgi:hypothetical protein
VRVGTNEAKSSPDLSPFKRHRIVIPVYIPNLEGYYSEALDVLHLCLASLRASIGTHASVTIVSNGSAPEVERDLRAEYEQGWIDQLLLNQRNWGRIDAVVSSARGTFEQLITISDCDVLFLPGWLEAVEDLFLKFPECGFASPVPGLNIWYHTSATMLSGMFRGELRMEKVVPEHDLDRISQSIRRNMFKAEHREAQLVIRRGDAVACVGSGHFLCTIRREVIDCMPRRPALRGLRGRASETWLDIPLDRSGFWRLSTTRAYAFHMGNVLEPWMYEELERSRERAVPVQENGEEDLPAVRRTFASRVPWRMRDALMQGVKRTRLRSALRLPSPV